MRINQIVIKNSGPLKNINTKLSQVTLIIGDNERGKTHFLNWISKGLFENSEQFKDESWTTTIGGKANVQMSVDPLYLYYDGERMRNLLFVKENDLLFFKHKTQEELQKHEYWNNEINKILYGQDEISENLQKSFLKAMGVSKTAKTSWLVQLHDGIFNLKQTLEDLLPEFEKINSKEYGLYQLNDSIGAISEVENQFESTQHLYFLMEKIKKAQQYFDCLDKKQDLKDLDQEIENSIQEHENLKIILKKQDDHILDTEDSIDELLLDIVKLQKTEDEVLNAPYANHNSSLGESILGFLIGLFMVIASISLAYQSMGITSFTKVKGLALVCFVIGVFFLLKTLFHSIYVQSLSDSTKDNPNFFHKFLIDKAQKNFTRSNDKLDHQKNLLNKSKEDVLELRKTIKSLFLKIETLKTQQRKMYNNDLELEKIEQIVFPLYETEDPALIYKKMQDWYALIDQEDPVFDYDGFQEVKSQKYELMNQRSNISHEYEHSKSHITHTIRGLIEELKNIDHKETIEYFYPELYRLQINSKDLGGYYELLEAVDLLVDQIGKDRYKSEKIINIYHNMESNSETLLTKTLNSSFFEYLVQNFFGGKYKSFVAEYVSQQGIKIFAENGHGERFPLENLGHSVYSQFWFLLRLSLAKTILNKQPGIILLDDPFGNFDSIRKQNFIDVINALVYEGWQVILTITNDEMIYSNFVSLFKSTLTIIDLNKDYE